LWLGLAGPASGSSWWPLPLCHARWTMQKDALIGLQTDEELYDVDRNTICVVCIRCALAADFAEDRTTLVRPDQDLLEGCSNAGSQGLHLARSKPGDSVPVDMSRWLANFGPSSVRQSINTLQTFFAHLTLQFRDAYYCIQRQTLIRIAAEPSIFACRNSRLESDS
jgi:hypothetical protein